LGDADHRLSLLRDKEGNGMAEIVGLQCSECKRRNYVTLVNKKKAQKKLEKKKHCKWCNKHTLHKETK
jgi:large subunit ribosomal protein L33